MSLGARAWLVGLVLSAVALRLPGLFANTFHADEALFATWARLIALWRDPLLLSQMVDKPPLLFYAQAFFYPLLGPVEWAARLPNLIASLLLIPLTAQLAWRLYGKELIAVLSAAFLTFSPLVIQFSPTAFIDPLLTTLIYSSLYCAVRVNGQDSSTKTETFALLSGLLFGLAAATKYQAWLFLPLLIGLAALHGWRGKHTRRWLAGLTPILILLVAWEMTRAEGAGILELQFTSYGGLRQAWSWELWQRLDDWGGQWGYLLASPIIGFFVLLAMPPFVALLIHDQDWPTAVDQLLVVFVLGYFLLHWLLAVPIWDRYILPLAPLVGIILTRFVWRLFAFFRPNLPFKPTDQAVYSKLLWFAPLVLLVIQAPAVVDARAGRLPVGGQPGADHGAAEIATLLSDEQYGTVLYDHWYSWQWRYHLLDQRVYVSWFAHPDALLDDLAVFGADGNRRYLAMPNSEAALPVARVVESAGFQLQTVKTSAQSTNMPAITLYRIIPK